MTGNDERRAKEIDAYGLVGAPPQRTLNAIELRRDLREGAPGTRDALIAEAAAHLVAARAALDLAECTAPLAHLEQVIVLLQDGCGAPR